MSDGRLDITNDHNSDFFMFIYPEHIEILEKAIKKAKDIINA